MNASSDSSATVTRTKRRRRSEPSATPANAAAVGETSSGEANRRAAAILEVLAGARTPSEAAEALDVSLPHFYLLERKALEGLVRACEVQPKGPPPPGAAEKLAIMEQQLAAAQRECQRLAALVRVTQRAVGLPAPPVQKPGSGKAAGDGEKTKGKRTRRRRRPSVRALRAAQTARQNAQRKEQAKAPESLKRPEEVVQRSVAGNGSSGAPSGAPPS